MRLFHGSITYLALLFLLVAIDPFVSYAGPDDGLGRAGTPRVRRAAGMNSTAIHTSPEPSTWMATSTHGSPVKYWT